MASKTKKPVKSAAKPAKKPVSKPAKAAAKPAKVAAKPAPKPAPKIAAKLQVKSALKPQNKLAKLIEEGEKLPPAKPLPAKDLAIYKDLLLKLRDRIVDEISFLANDNLNRNQRESSGDLSSYSFHMADQGTDNFDREFAANLLSSEQDVLYEIDEALRRIDQGTYGICEMSGQPIEKERLKVLPFARYSVAVQSEMERGKPRYRPFRRTSIQQVSESST